MRNWRRLVDQRRTDLTDWQRKSEWKNRWERSSVSIDRDFIIHMKNGCHFIVRTVHDIWIVCTAKSWSTSIYNAHCFRSVWFELIWFDSSDHWYTTISRVLNYIHIHSPQSAHQLTTVNPALCPQSSLPLALSLFPTWRQFCRSTTSMVSSIEHGNQSNLDTFRFGLSQSLLCNGIVRSWITKVVMRTTSRLSLGPSSHI